MKITTLIEDQSGKREDLSIEHGLSMYIEVDGKNILFDTGASGDFIDNAKKLDVDLKNLDYVIISHGHYDHSGGLERLMKEIKPDIKLFLGSGFFQKKYNLMENGYYQYTGNFFDKSFLEEYNIKTEYIDKDKVKVTEALSIFTNFNKQKDFENINEIMYVEENGKYKKDMFLDEISIGIKTKKGLVVLVGCSHVGIVNILDTIAERTVESIYALIGGTHLITEDHNQINKVIEYLREKDIKIIGACHCTGTEGETMLSQQLEEAFIKNNTGDVLKF